MSLLEQEVIRMAAALDDYEHAGVSDIGGDEKSGYWLCVVEDRLGLHYEIASHADDWDFLGYFASGLHRPPNPLVTTSLHWCWMAQTSDTAAEVFPGITMDPQVRFGKPCIAGTRVDVATVVGAPRSW